jgi:hypothetical protein
VQSSRKACLINTNEVIQFESPYSIKKHLQEIQSIFSPDSILNETIALQADDTLYLYANDIHIDNYLLALDQEVFSKKPISTLENFKFQFFNIPPAKKIGIVIGNSCIISLIPDIQADDILLLDIQPIIQNFILYIKNLILNTSERNFEETKKNIIKNIENYEKRYHVSRDEGLQLEMAVLGDKHFLSSETRFNLCKQALKEKDLLPVQINLFDEKAMQKFSQLLNKEKLQISFLNLTNVSEYINAARNFSPFSYFKNLKNLPLSTNCSIISTKLINNQNYLIAKNINELELSHNKKLTQAI